MTTHTASPAVRHIPARIWDRCPTRSCLVVSVPADPMRLFPDLWAEPEEQVVRCAGCLAAAAEAEHAAYLRQRAHQMVPCRACGSEPAESCGFCGGHGEEQACGHGEVEGQCTHADCWAAQGEAVAS